MQEDESTTQRPPSGSDHPPARPTEMNAADLRGGDRVAHYKILEPLGEGGFAVVYLADQEKPVRRRVALKIIKLGMDTKQVIARFEVERQALAMMDHPNIAKVFDAGATETGRPYFVMELVKGIPITEYCDKNNLSTKDRLDLFMPICHAIQHAHHKGIIHRDIKPSNVMLTLHDGKPVPKVIDFGIAKATDHRLTEKTLFTEYRQLIGTPAYMSPEQAEMSGLDIDTRSDIYSLGVLLYELLTGTTPFDSNMLRQAGYGEIQRIIREVEPPKPSTRLSSLATEPGAQATGSAPSRSGSSSLAEIAKHRRTDPSALSRLIRGDLDWIVMKALEKDRTRRYETAKELAKDVEHHLANEPVLAGPPGAIYRFKKLTLRHKVPLAFVTVLFLLVTVFGVWMSILYSQAQSSLARAQEAEAKTAKEAETTKQVSDFLVGMLRVSDPGEKKGNSITARELLDRAVERIRHQLKDQPEVQVRLMETAAEVYRNLGLRDASVPLMKSALETRRQHLGDDHTDTIGSMHNYGVLLWERGKHQEAEPLLREAFEARRRVLGPDNPRTLVSLNMLGTVLEAEGKIGEAEATFRKSLELHRSALGDEHQQTLETLRRLSGSLLGQDKLAEGGKLMKRTLETCRRVHGDDHNLTIYMLGDVADVLVHQGKVEEARPYVVEMLPKWRRILGEHPPAGMLYMYGWRLLTCEPADLRDPAEALHIAKKAVEMNDAKNPNFLNWLALAYKMTGDLERAIETVKQALAVVPPGESWGRAYAETMLVSMLREQGNDGAAESVLQVALARVRNAHGEQNIKLAQRMTDLALLLLAKGEYVTHARFCGALTQVREGALAQPQRARYVGSWVVGLGFKLVKQKRHAEAEVLLRECMEIQRMALPKGDWRIAKTISILAESLAGQARFDEAEPMLLDAYGNMKDNPTAPTFQVQRVLERIVNLYESWGNPDEAAKYRAMLPRKNSE